MNRNLAIPLVITMISFCAVYFAQTTYGEPLTPENVIASFVDQPNMKAKPIAFKDARTLVLDQWPTLGEYHFASRIAPSQPLYATLGEMAAGRGQDKIDDDDTSFLCTLYISATPKLKNGKVNQDDVVRQTIKMLNLESNNRFPVHVDRHTKSVHIFAESQWQEYATWRDKNLPKYKELTGWNVDTAKRYGKGGFLKLPLDSDAIDGESTKPTIDGQP